MRALLDTHVLLWFVAGDQRLSRTARELIEERSGALVLSAVTAAEISLKVARGKLRLPTSPITFVPQLVQELGLTSLPISMQHGLRLAELPLHHLDPFDRLLVAQALDENLAIITSDPLFTRYSVKVIW